MSSKFRKATRQRARLRLGLCGPSGSGKTYTGLRLAFAIAEARGREAGRPGRVAVIDTESGSASKYVGESPDGFPWDFEVCELTTFSPSEYTAALEDAAASGYDVVLVDSLTHAWEGKDGALELVDKKKTGNNSFTAWKDVTPLHRRMVEAILTSPCDVICTLRAKTEYVLETNERGKQVPRKIGTAPIQRQGMEYEFDLFADLDHSHILTVTKSRCNPLDGATVVKPGPGFARPLIAWLMTGEEVAAGQAVARLNGHADRAALVEQVLREAERIGWSRAKVDTEVRGKYARTLDEILVTELEEFATRLSRLPAKKAPTPVVTTEDIPEPRISDQQLANAKDLHGALVTALGGSKEEATTKWLEILARYGVKSARDLTRTQADLFLAAARNEIQLAKEGGDPFTGGVSPTPVSTPAPTPPEPPASNPSEVAGPGVAAT